MPMLSRPTAALLLGLGVLLLAPPPATAAGRNLDGRLAPELVFPAGVGLGGRMRLSDYRGKVVWLKFVLRDCPRCRSSLPAMQSRHELWSGSGLVVIAVMHEYGPDQIRAWQKRDGVDVPTGQDPQGALARAYGVNHRPADYVIGVDGRVKQSNGASDAVLRAELARYRRTRVGDVPPVLGPARDAVERWDYGEALRLAEPLAAAEGAEASVRDATARIVSLAREELAGRVAYAERLAARGRRSEAQAFLGRVVAYFRGTGLEADAARALRALEAPARGAR